MNVTFLVGNGFDISCGLKTSYKDFYEWYCMQEKSEKAHVNRFREEIDADLKNGKGNWADFEVALGQYTKNFTLNTVQDFIDCYEDAHDNLMRYLKEESSRFNQFNRDYVRSRVSDSLCAFSAELKEQEKKELDRSFRKLLYMDNTYHFSFISYNYTNLLDLSIAAAETFSQGIVMVYDDKTHRIVPEQITFSIHLPVIHVHGKLDQYPVFGVNDVSQIANRALLDDSDFSTIMIKPNAVNAIGNYQNKEAEKIIDKSHVICIYGMSLGITDALWFHKIMDWLKADENRHLIVYWYTKTPSNDRSILRRIKNEKEAKEKLTYSYSLRDLSSEQKNRLFSRIHIIENTKKVLQLKLDEAMKNKELVFLPKIAAKSDTHGPTPIPLSTKSNSL